MLFTKEATQKSHRNVLSSGGFDRLECDCLVLPQSLREVDDVSAWISYSFFLDEKVLWVYWTSRSLQDSGMDL